MSRPPIIAVLEPIVPSIASLLRYLQCITVLEIGPDLYGILLSLHYLKCKSKRCVVCNVAMHEPCTRVVGLERDDDIAVGWK
jgi:hypothetical protein